MAAKSTSASSHCQSFVFLSRFKRFVLEHSDRPQKSLAGNVHWNHWLQQLQLLPSWCADGLLAQSEDRDKK